jgi:hypothetical protein
MGTALAALLSLDRDDPSSMLATALALAGELPQKVVPFGEDAGGDYSCFDYRSSDSNPTVVYWHHERAGDDSISPLAPSFTHLLEMLRDHPLAAEP